MAWPDVGCRPLALLYLRIELPDRHAQLGARFEHLGTGADQSEVLIIGDIDQPVENRVVEYLPPIPIFLIPRVDRRIVCFEPFLGDRCRRRSKVRADETPGAAKRHKDSQSWKPQNRPARLPPSGAAHKHSPPGVDQNSHYPVLAFGPFSLRKIQVQAGLSQSRIRHPALQELSRSGGSAPGPAAYRSARRDAFRQTPWPTECSD